MENTNAIENVWAVMVMNSEDEKLRRDVADMDELQLCDDILRCDVFQKV